MKSIGCLTGLSALALLLGACTSVPSEGEDSPTPAPAAHRHRTVGLARSAGLAAEKPVEQPAAPKTEVPKARAEEPAPTPEPQGEVVVQEEETSGFFDWLFGGETAADETAAPAAPAPAVETAAVAAPKPAAPPAAKPEPAAETEKESGGFFSWLFGSSKDEEETPRQTVEVKPEVTPTPAQQAAAQKALRETPAVPEPSTASDTSLLAPGVDDTPASTRNGLRLGNFAPPEEAASRAESTTPRPNAVELRGLRSPMLRGGRLPMDINGKLTTDKEDHE